MFREISENFLLTSSKFIEQKEYWVKKLSGTIAKTRLLTLENTSPLAAKGNKTVHIDITGDLYRKVTAVGKNSQLSLYIILLTCLKVLLYRYTNNKDITVISPLFKPHLSGKTINRRVFVRDWIEGGMTFKELLLKIRKNLLEVYANQDYPSDRLIDTLLKNRQIEERECISDIICALENIHHSGYCTTLEDKLIFSFVKEENRVKGSILYHTSRYETCFVEKIPGHFLHLLEYALADIHVKISGIPLLSQQEKTQLIVDFNQTRATYPRDRTICELFEQQAAKSPDTISITCDKEQISFRQLNETVQRLSSHLSTRGVQPGAIVALIMEPSIALIAAAAAIIKAGAAYLPIPLQYPPNRIDYILKDSHCRLVLTQPHLSGKFDSQIDTVAMEINRQWYQTDTGTTAKHPPGPADPVYMIYTSGSTGKSKGVLIEHRNLVNYISWFVCTVNLTSGDRTLLTSSFAFDLGYTAVYSALLTGCQLHIYQGNHYWQGDILIDYIKMRAISYIKMTPSLFNLIVESPAFSGELFETLRLIVLGGEKINVKDVEKAYLNRQDRPLRIMNHYGPTETTIGCIARFIDFNHFEEYNLRPTIGRPISNTRAAILDSHLNLLPAGVPGEICVSGDGVARGYLNRPQLSWERFIPDPYQPGKAGYKTGDLGRWLPNGNIEFLGRIDQQVKIRGYRIEPAEVENLLLTHKQVKEAVVTVNEHHDGIKYLCAYWVSNKTGIITTNKLNTTELREYLTKNLPDYMVPLYFIQVERIPLTPNGKPDRKALPGPDPGTPGNDYTAPRDKVEKKLVELWAEILGIEKDHIGTDGNFFQLGGHSLNATVLLSRIHKVFDVKIPLVEIFTNPTIRGLAAAFKKTTKVRCVSLEPVEKKEYYPLSSAQRRMYFSQQMAEYNTVYNISLSVTLTGDVNKNKLENAFRTLIKRHQSLRTSFEIIAAQPVQRIHDNIQFTVQYNDIISLPGEEKEEEPDILKHFVKPFDLSQTPLLRVGLLKTGKNIYILLVDMHHIITDGLSQNILKKEFMQLYAGQVLPGLKLQYKDYSERQQFQAANGGLKQQEDYWLGEFKEEIPRLIIPTDYSKPKAWSFEGKEMRFEIGSRQTRILNEIALSQGATLFMVLLAITNVFLAKIGSREDIVVGTDAAGRNHADLAPIMGMFVNTLPLRNAPAAEKTFNGFLREVKEKTLKAFENQDYQFEDLVARVWRSRDTSRNPIFDVMFCFYNNDTSNTGVLPSTAKNALQLKQHLDKYENKTAKFDLLLHAVKVREHLSISFEYCTKLFKEETINKFTGYFRDIVSAVTKNENIQLKNIPIFLSLLNAKQDTPQIDFGF
jgi:amino acid adenylation domain-containing protein